VIAAHGANAIDLSKGGQYGQQQPISLVVSAGAVPDVAGKTVADATAALKDVDLTATPGQENYSDTVPAEGVIGIDVPNGTVLKPGDTVRLIVSKGPEPVTIPDVVGMKWADAKKALIAAGLVPDYNKAADTFPGLFTVTKLTPGANSQAPKGSSVKVNFSSSI